jgi:hypothetical protein
VLDKIGNSIVIRFLDNRNPFDLMSAFQQFVFKTAEIKKKKKELW